MHRCPECQSERVRRSKRRGFVERVPLRLLLLQTVSLRRLQASFLPVANDRRESYPQEALQVGVYCQPLVEATQTNDEWVRNRAYASRVHISPDCAVYGIGVRYRTSRRCSPACWLSPVRVAICLDGFSFAPNVKPSLNIPRLAMLAWLVCFCPRNLRLRRPATNAYAQIAVTVRPTFEPICCIGFEFA